MKSLLAVFGFVLMIGMSSMSASAQDNISNDDGSRPERRVGDRRPNLMLELNLSAEQVEQIRRLNQDRRPQMDAAISRLREANQKLDEAIYSDTLNEADVKNRLKEAQNAQAEVAQLRFTNELAVRKVLTPDQLIRFRELRRQFAERRQEFRNGRRSRRGLPLRRINRPARPVSN